MIKKLLIFSLVFVGMFTLSACDKDDGPTDLVKLGEAMADLDIALEVSADITFVETGLHDVEITWESSNTDVIADDGTVTRPLFSEGDETVTITAFLTIGDETLTKIFTVKVLKIANISEAEQVAEAKGSLLLTVTDLVVGDIILPVEVVKDDFTAVVTWTSGNTDIITDAGVVTRPTEGDGNTVVVMTATITVGAASDTKTFEVMVKEQDPQNLFATIALLHGSTLGDIVEFQGVVVATFDGGYFLSDGTHSLGIYSPASTLGIVVGDEVYVKGSYAVYNTLYQIGDISDEAIIGSGNANPLVPVVKTVAEMLALDTSNKLMHGMPYTVTGTLTIIGDYGNIYLVVGDDELLIYYYSLETSIAALEAEVGKEITITIYYYTNHGTNGPMVAFDGGADDIEVSSISDVDAVAADILAAGVDVPGITLDDIVLPTVGPNGSTYSNWVSSDVAVILSNGTFVARDTTSVTITFTADVAKGTETGVATFEVVVPVLSTIAEALALGVSDYLEVSGIIYDISYYGFFIEQGGNYIYVYNNSFLDLIAVGDEITILGTRGFYSGLAQVNVVSYELGTTGNAVPSAVVLSVGDLANGLVPKGTIATVTGTYAIVVGSDGYDDYVITDSAGSVFEVYYRSDVAELTTFLDTTITLDLVYYNNSTGLFNGVAADVTASAVFTDAIKAADAAAGIDLGDVNNVDSDLTLPLTNTNGATIVWATDDAVHITAEGVVTRVLGSDTVVTLTATVTVGSETATRVIEVTVLDSTGFVPMTVAMALLEDDAEVILVQGFITNVYGSSVLVIQDADGVAAITTYDYGFFADNSLALGDEIVVRATRDTYYGLNELVDMTLIEVVSTGNAFPVVTVTVAELVTDMVAETFAYQGQNFILTGLTIVDMDYDGKEGYIVVKDDQDPANEIIFSTYDVPYAQDLLAVDDVIDLSVTGWDFYYSAVRVKVYAYPALNDVDTVFMSEIALDIPLTVTEDMTLPLVEPDFGATVAWATDTAGVISDAGVVVRPAAGESDATVILTATITSGSESTTKAFTVTVTAEVAAPTQTLFFSEYGEPSGGICKYVEIYNPTDATIDLTGWTISSPDEGDLFSTDYRVDTLTGNILAGQTIVVGAPECFDGSDSGSLAGGFPQTGITYIVSSGDAVAFFNGDDAVGLFNGDVLVDAIGFESSVKDTMFTVGTGSDNTQNVILVRLPSVSTGETDWSVGQLQWTVKDHREYSDVGIHTID